VLYLAGALGATALANQNATAINQWSLSAAAFLLVAGWAAWQKFKAKQVLVTALASSVPMSEQDAKAMVKDPSTFTPSVTTPKDQVPG
jgi:arginine exporter protein ArgO